MPPTAFAHSRCLRPFRASSALRAELVDVLKDGLAEQERKDEEERGTRKKKAAA